MHPVLRMQRLSRLSQALSELDSEGELERYVVAALFEVFAPVARINLFLSFGEQMGAAGAMYSMSAVLARLRAPRGEDESAAAAVLRAPHLFARDPRDVRGSLMSMPIIMRGEFVGLIVVERAPSGPPLTFSDLEALSGVGGQVGFALLNLRRHMSTRRMRLAEDLRQAREVQHRLLPTLPPQVGPLRVAAAYRPAFEVGGDFYDLVLGESGATHVVIGDVAGSGVAAALIMARISSDFRRLARADTSPAAILAELDLSISESKLEHAFVTATCLRFDRTGRVLHVASAGHLPLMLRRGERGIELHGRNSGVPLGVLQGQQWVEERLELDVGDILLLTTDGALEAIDPEAGVKGLLRLAKLLREAPRDVEAVAAHVLEAVVRAEGRSDDVAVLSLQVADCP